MIEVYIKKLNRTLEVDFDSLPKSSQLYIIAYGLKQSLNDSLASAIGTAEMEGKLGKRLDAILEGTMGQRAESLSGPTALEREAYQVAKRLIIAKLGRGLPKDQLEAKAREFATHPKVIEKAQAILLAKQAASGLEGIDL